LKDFAEILLLIKEQLDRIEHQEHRIKSIESTLRIALRRIEKKIDALSPVIEEKPHLLLTIGPVSEQP
jgi:hypothetical protein